MNKLYKAFQSITPNNFEEIKENVKTRDEEVHIIMETKKKKNYYKFAIIPIVCLMLIAVPFVTGKNNTVFATVGVDVNPSVEFNINNKEEVLDVIAHNDDGKKIIGDMKLEGSDIDVAMNALIGSMLKEGYIDELKNSLLISVTGDNQEENERLRKELSQNIDELLKGNHIEGSIVSQTLNNNEDLETLAKKYNISVGKAEIIQQLIQKNSLYTFESLKDLSVNDLNILLASNNVDNVQVSGKASTGSYISQEKAKQIVESDAKISQPTYKKVELDYDDGKMIYELEFTKNSVEYEYDLDASTGKILNKETENHQKSSSQNQSSSSNKTTSSTSNISESKAKSIAMNNAGVSSVTNYTIQKDYDDGVLEYDIEFVANNKKYEYTIRASDGAILDKDTENVSSAKITGNDAKNKALNHAGVSYKDIRDMDVELENNYYEVSFETSTYEYDYKIDASSGKVIHHEKEKND